MAERITPLLQALLDCVTDRLTLDGRPVCVACVVAGSDTPPADGCDCRCDGGQGRAWIRMVDLSFTSRSDNRSAGADVSKCPIGAWNLNLEIGVWRCVKDTQGRCADAVADATAFHADAVSVIVGIQCCDALRSLAWTPSQARPLGPLGGCIATVYDLTVQLDKLTGP
jgi:hypothetical protein